MLIDATEMELMRLGTNQSVGAAYGYASPPAAETMGR